ncbi:MAG TPA: ATP-binding protein [Anaerohalosphaeraceae bacterium]|nr:ATP-binding protein [Anaerohalosphaeraceae bacterium]HOL88961.1 ATP-binding protein [Anaerohalosphaeraceae bacterium]HPP56113.1 ATP-binding protein [Anaerohalosphaeraceae bacterium]
MLNLFRKLPKTYSFSTVAQAGAAVIFAALLIIALVSIYFHHQTYEQIECHVQCEIKELGLLSEIIYEFSKTAYTFRTSWLNQSSNIEPSMNHLHHIEKILEELKTKIDNPPPFHQQLQDNVKKCKTLLYAYQSTYFKDPSRDLARESLEAISTILEDSKEKSIYYCRIVQEEIQRTLGRLTADLKHTQVLISLFLLAAEAAIIGVVSTLYLLLKYYLKQMIEAADAIRQGDLSHRIEQPHSDLIGQAALRLNQMAERVQQTEEELRKSNDHLLELLEEVRKADVMKSEFLANMSHEIRTPMSAILGFGELLKEEEQLSGRQKEYIQMILNNGRMLLQLINDILDFSKIEAGKLKVEMIDFSLSEFLEDLFSTLHPLAAAKGLQFEILQCSDLPGTLNSDPVRLRQCLINLAGNAIKFTEKGHVFINVMKEQEDDADFIRFDVEDTGIGIPEDKLAVIFDAFTQADSSMTRRYGGTGLGLSITKRLTELLGGKITVHSTVGRGSVFSIRLPTGIDPSKQTSHNRYETAEKAIHQPSEEEAEQIRLSGRILVAEDAKANQMLIRLLLEKEGLQAVVVENGQEALQAVLREPFDLVLMDMQMPVMSGLEAAQAIRAKGLTLPIIALTALAMKGDDEKCLKAGCSDYLTKPIDRKALRQILQKYLSNNAAAKH